jgi:hypothetical protein
MQNMAFGKSLNRSEMKKILGGVRVGGGGCDIMTFRCCSEGGACGAWHIAEPPYRCGGGKITDSACHS